MKLDVTIAMFLGGMSIVLASESAKAGPTRLGLVPSKVVLRGTDSVQQLAVDRLVGGQEPGDVTGAARFDVSFVSSGYDLEALIRAICNCRVYGLSSAPNGSNAKDRRSFARHYPRRMSAEVLLDAIAQVSACSDPVRGIAGRYACHRIAGWEYRLDVPRRVRTTQARRLLRMRARQRRHSEPEPDAVEDIIWALLNAKEFQFID